MDTLYIEGLQIDALIGVYDEERLARQPLIFDVELGVDARIPALSDEAADAVDYATVCERLRQFVGESEVRLIETLAELCCAVLLREFPVEHVKLRLAKPRAVPGTRVGIVVERRREPGVIV